MTTSSARSAGDAGRAAAEADRGRTQETAREVLNEVVWDALCDTIDNKLPKTKQDLIDYLVDQAVAHGITLAAGDAGELASKVLAAARSGDQDASSIESTCDRLKQSGL